MPPTETPHDSSRELRRHTEVADASHERLQLDRRENEAQKNTHTILEQAIQQAQEDLERPAKAIALSGFTAGLDLGLGPFLMGVVLTLTRGQWTAAASEIAVALAYSAGFVFVVLGRSSLFTEQTTSAVLPVLARRVRAVRLLRLWAVVLATNLLGAVCIAAIAAWLGPRLGVIDATAMQQIANRLQSHDAVTIAMSAVVAGWIMGLLSWLVVAARDTVSQLLIVVLCSFSIGIAGLHHSIAGSVEMLMAAFAQPQVEIGATLRVVAIAVLGNAIGGSVFVGLLKFGHVSASTQ